MTHSLVRCTRFVGVSASLALAACTLPPAGTPRSAQPPLNPTVTTLVGEISPERIERTIRALAAFETRHTLSETESDTRGIGAARRWIKRELESCARRAGDRLLVEFDEYIEPPGRRMPRAVKIVNVWQRCLAQTRRLAAASSWSAAITTRGQRRMDATSSPPAPTTMRLRRRGDGDGLRDGAPPL